MDKRYVKFSIIMPDRRLMLSLMLILFLSTTLLFCTMPFEVQADSSVITDQNPALLIDNSGFPFTYSRVGDHITYTYDIINTGNVNITGPIEVNDSKYGVISVTTGNLTPGQSITKTIDYFIKQEDVDEGSVINTAHATGTSDGRTIESKTDREIIVAQQNPALNIDKLASPSTYSDVGDQIVYTYKITNTGNVNITAPITVTDNKTGTINITEDLVPGQNISVNSIYIIKQKDLDTGYVTNAAFAAGNYRCLTIVSNTDTETIKEVQSPYLIIEKSASPTTYSYVGQIITYTYKITNSRKMVVTEPITISDNITGSFQIPVNILEPGKNVTGNSTYTIKQADIDAGFVTNSAFASGKVGNNTTTSNVDNETVKAVQNPALLIKKLASPANYSAVGQVITYTYNITNIGNVNITEPIKVTDNKTGIINLTERTLEPGKSLFANSTYVITQADIYSGFITNAAFATGKSGNNTTTSNNVNETVTADQVPKLVIEKSAHPTSYSYIGQLINYTYNVTNTGNVNITGPLKVTDNRTGTINVTQGNLTPGQSILANTTYTIKKEDLNSGFVTNLAFATGTFRNDTITSNNDSETIIILRNASYGIDKII